MKQLRIAVLACCLVVACKQRQAPESTESTLAANQGAAPFAMVIAGFDGPRDHGEINRGMIDGALRCLANPALTCHLVLPAGDLSYRQLSKDCGKHPRCSTRFYKDEAGLGEVLKFFNGRVRVGLLIGHYTGSGIWDFPGLTPEALDGLAEYPLVLRICNSTEFAADQPGLIPVGTGLLSEDDTNYVTIIQTVLSGP